MENRENITISDDDELLVYTLPDGVLQKIVDFYEKARSYEDHIQIIGAIVLIGGSLIHNLFIAGNSYLQEQYETIMHTEFSIIGLTIVAILTLWLLSSGHDREAKSLLKDSANKNSLNLRNLTEEVNSILIQLSGGTGLK